MKKILSILLATVLVFSLSACSGVDMNTPKSGELTKQYDYYYDSMNKLRAGMDITPEQADEVFIALVSCGLNEAIGFVTDNKDSSFSVNYGSTYWDVAMKDGVVERITNYGTVLYPEAEVKALEEAKAAEEARAKEEATAVAIVVDSQVFQIVLNSEEIVALLQQGVTMFSNGEISTLDLYDLAKQSKEAQANLSYTLSGLRDESSQDYIDSCTLYVINGKTFAEKLMKYLDKEELEYLSEATECITNSESLVLSVVVERSAYLSAQGVPAEQISEIMGAESKPATSEEG